MAERLTRLERQVAAVKVFTANLAQDHLNCNGENKRTLDWSLSRVAHSGKPLSAMEFSRALQPWFVNEERVYTPPALSDAYRAFGSKFLTCNKDICGLSVYFAHALRPLDVYLERLPIYEARDKAMAKEIHQLLDVMYNVLFQGMAVGTKQRVNRIAKRLKTKC
ncbi:hypothetical protein GGI20_000582 [Coemansia sp. BCRC 34301]|nr:hypothetical protein GGI20_000582 [Coemansia sp. BCRC 34301]